MESDDYFIRGSNSENSDNCQLQADDGDPLSSLFANVGSCIAENTQSILDNILDSSENEIDSNIEEVFVLANDFFQATDVKVCQQNGEPNNITCGMDADIPYNRYSSGSNYDDDIDTSYDISHIYGHKMYNKQSTNSACKSIRFQNTLCPGGNDVCTDKRHTLMHNESSNMQQTQGQCSGMNDTEGNHIQGRNIHTMEHNENMHLTTRAQGHEDTYFDSSDSEATSSISDVTDCEWDDMVHGISLCKTLLDDLQEKIHDNKQLNCEKESDFETSDSDSDNTFGDLFSIISEIVTVMVGSLSDHKHESSIDWNNILHDLVGAYYNICNRSDSVSEEAEIETVIVYWMEIAHELFTLLYRVYEELRHILIIGIKGNDSLAESMQNWIDIIREFYNLLCRLLGQSHYECNGEIDASVCNYLSNWINKLLNKISENLSNDSANDPSELAGEFQSKNPKTDDVKPDQSTESITVRKSISNTIFTHICDSLWEILFTAICDKFHKLTDGFKDGTNYQIPDDHTTVQTTSPDELSAESKYVLKWISSFLAKNDENVEQLEPYKKDILKHRFYHFLNQIRDYCKAEKNEKANHVMNSIKIEYPLNEWEEVVQGIVKINDSLKCGDITHSEALKYLLEIGNCIWNDSSIFLEGICRFLTWTMEEKAENEEEKQGPCIEYSSYYEMACDTENPLGGLSDILEALTKILQWTEPPNASSVEKWMDIGLLARGIIKVIFLFGEMKFKKSADKLSTNTASLRVTGLLSAIVYWICEESEVFLPWKCSKISTDDEFGSINEKTSNEKIDIISLFEWFHSIILSINDEFKHNMESSIYELVPHISQILKSSCLLYLMMLNMSGETRAAISVNIDYKIIVLQVMKSVKNCYYILTTEHTPNSSLVYCRNSTLTRITRAIARVSEKSEMLWLKGLTNLINWFLLVFSRKLKMPKVSDTFGEKTYEEISILELIYRAEGTAIDDLSQIIDITQNLYAKFEMNRLHTHLLDIIHAEQLKVETTNIHDSKVNSKSISSEHAENVSEKVQHRLWMKYQGIFEKSKWFHVGVDILAMTSLFLEEVLFICFTFLFKDESPNIREKLSIAKGFITPTLSGSRLDGSESLQADGLNLSDIDIMCPFHRYDKKYASCIEAVPNRPTSVFVKTNQNGPKYYNNMLCNQYGYLSPLTCKKYLLNIVSELISYVATLISIKNSLDSKQETAYCCLKGELALTLIMLDKTRNQWFSLDCVPSIFLDFWPEQAQNWVGRSTEWPDSTAKDAIISGGCHIVPKPSKDGDPNREWRLSFSKAETTLCKSFTGSQSFHLALLKTQFNRIKSKIGTTEIKLVKQFKTIKGVFHTYHMKTVMFWFCEKYTPCHAIWEEENVFYCQVQLLDLVEDMMRNAYIPHYFIPEQNLLEDVPSKCIQEAIVELKSLKQEAKSGNGMVYQEIINHDIDHKEK